MRMSVAMGVHDHQGYEVFHITVEVCCVLLPCNHYISPDELGIKIFNPHGNNSWCEPWYLILVEVLRNIEIILLCLVFLQCRKVRTAITRNNN